MIKQAVAVVAALVAVFTGSAANTPTQEKSAKSMYITHNIGKKTAKTISERYTIGGERQPRSLRDRDKFTTSRGYKAKQLVILQYARWYAKRKLGYTQKQWKMVHWMWYQESRWDWEASNPSGAYGIPQMKTTNKILDPFRQVELGFKYIEHRYGSPEAAHSHWKKHGSY